MTQRIIDYIVGAVVFLIILGVLLLAGNVFANADNGGQVITGTPGPDKLVGGRGPDTLIGLAGDDRLWGGRGPDVFKCGPGYDIVHSYAPGAENNDTIGASCERVVR